MAVQAALLRHLAARPGSSQSSIIERDSTFNSRRARLGLDRLVECGWASTGVAVKGTRGVVGEVGYYLTARGVQAAQITSQLVDMTGAFLREAMVARILSWYKVHGGCSLTALRNGQGKAYRQIEASAAAVYTAHLARGGLLAANTPASRRYALTAAGHDWLRLQASLEALRGLPVPVAPIAAPVEAAA